MQATIDIAFDELVQIARKLPKRQWAKLKEEVEEIKNGRTKQKRKHKEAIA